MQGHLGLLLDVPQHGSDGEGYCDHPDCQRYVKSQVMTIHF
jgi:hypothetical protein